MVVIIRFAHRGPPYQLDTWLLHVCFALCDVDGERDQRGVVVMDAGCLDEGMACT